METLLEKIKQYKSYQKHISLRDRFGCMHPGEMLDHDIQLLKSEKEILQVIEMESFALIALDNNPEIRDVFDSFVKGQITGMFINNGKVAWEPLYQFIDRTIEDLQQKYDESELLNKQITALERKRNKLR